MRRFFNKLATGVMVATMAFAALAPVTTMAAEDGHVHSFRTATYENGYLKTCTCGTCGSTVNFVSTVDVDKCKHPSDARDWYNGVVCDCTHDGKNSDTVCTDCGKVLNFGETLYAYGHEWDEGVVTLAPTATTEGKKKFTCEMCSATKEETLPKLSTGTTTPTTPGKDDKKPSTSTTPSTPDEDDKKDSDTIPIKETLAKVGTKYTIGGNQYTVTKAGKEVRFSKANAKKKSITIPATIKAAGISYKVTEIGANAFKNNKKVKKVVIGANVSKIAKKAFNKCPNLKTVVIKSTKLTKKTANKKCFNKVNKKMVIKTQKKVKKIYAKIFKGLKVR